MADIKDQIRYKEFTEEDSVHSRIESLDGDPLIIFKCQYNVGVAIVHKFIDKGCLKFDEMRPINVFILGPIYVRLLNQMKTDLKIYQKSRCDTRVTSSKCTNSSSMHPHAERFIKSLQTRPNTLHILIHDEAHREIAKGSMINEFLAGLEAVTKSVPNVHLLILYVSATICVLTKGVDFIAENDDSIFDWNELRKSNPLFAVPTYVPIEELEFERDDNIGRIKDTKKNAAASEAVMEEYIEAARYYTRSATDDPSCPETIAAKVISTLIESESPCMAVVRLRLIDHARKLSNKIQKFNPPFLVVALLDDEKLEQQLKRQGVVNGVANFSELNDHRCLVIVVDRLRVGERIPNTCAFWDIRCRYRNQGISSLATFVQDVGRCAGHGKKRTIQVFVGVDHKKNENIKGYDLLLPKKSGKAVKARRHPEFHGDGVYSGLKNYTVVLEASPQIGKTGAILSMVEIIDNMMGKAPKID